MFISDNIRSNNVDFPLPTYPIIATNEPFLIFKFRFSNLKGMFDIGHEQEMPLIEIILFLSI
jgi:hypothetical protein